MITNTRHKVLVLRLKDPSRVLSIIPTAKPFLYKGQELTVVPHGLTEYKLLKNLGLDPPHPVNAYYPWPGAFAPMDAQRETVRFLTAHNRAYCLNDLGCVDAATEFLTPTGWKRIDQYAGEPVAQYLPESGAIEFVDSPEYVKLPCDEMVRVKSKYGIDQLLSPEHRVLLHARSNPHKQEVVQAAALLARQDLWIAGMKKRKSLQEIGFSEAAIPAVFSVAANGVDLPDEQLRVMCAVIADSHFPNNTNRCVLRLKKQRKVGRLRTLLLAAGL